MWPPSLPRPTGRTSPSESCGRRYEGGEAAGEPVPEAQGDFSTPLLAPEPLLRPVDHRLPGHEPAGPEEDSGEAPPLPPRGLQPGVRDGHDRRGSGAGRASGLRGRCLPRAMPSGPREEPVRRGPRPGRPRRHVDAWWSDGEVRPALRRAGFGRIRAWDGARIRPKKLQPRRGYDRYYLARKRTAEQAARPTTCGARSKKSAPLARIRPSS